MSDRYPTTWERFLLWISRGKQQPTHDCRDWMPSAASLPLGTLSACPKCHAELRIEEYDVDDIYGGSTWYRTWRGV